MNLHWKFNLLCNRNGSYLNLTAFRKCIPTELKQGIACSVALASSFQFHQQTKKTKVHLKCLVLQNALLKAYRYISIHAV